MCAATGAWLWNIWLRPKGIILNNHNNIVCSSVYCATVYVMFRIASIVLQCLMCNRANGNGDVCNIHDAQTDAHQYFNPIYWVVSLGLCAYIVFFFFFTSLRFHHFFPIEYYRLYSILLFFFCFLSSLFAFSILSFCIAHKSTVHGHKFHMT